MSSDGRAPLEIHGAGLKGVRYATPVASDPNFLASADNPANPSACTNYYGVRINPGNTGNVRFQLYDYASLYSASPYGYQQPALRLRTGSIQIDWASPCLPLLSCL